MDVGEKSGRLLTQSEVQQRLNVTRQTLFRLRRRGVLHAVLVGRAVRFEESEVEAYIAAAREERVA